LVIVSIQDIVNSFECPFYLDEDSGHREQGWGTRAGRIQV